VGRGTSGLAVSTLSVGGGPGKGLRFGERPLSVRGLHPPNGRGGASLRRLSETRRPAAARGVPSQLSLLFQEQQKMNSKSQDFH
ncbi:hypothetical protein MC885_000463, partial [Smutsia gigantea]